MGSLGPSAVSDQGRPQKVQCQDGVSSSRYHLFMVFFAAGLSSMSQGQTRASGCQKHETYPPRSVFSCRRMSLREGSDEECGVWELRGQRRGGSRGEEIVLREIGLFSGKSDGSPGGIANGRFGWFSGLDLINESQAFAELQLPKPVRAP